MTIGAIVQVCREIQFGHEFQHSREGCCRSNYFWANRVVGDVPQTPNDSRTVLRFPSQPIFGSLRERYSLWPVRSTATTSAERSQVWINGMSLKIEKCHLGWPAFHQGPESLVLTSLIWQQASCP
jgi:hypothetical protein